LTCIVGHNRSRSIVHMLSCRAPNTKTRKTRKMGP
jgi:hypothetical protein